MRAFEWVAMLPGDKVPNMMGFNVPPGALRVDCDGVCTVGSSQCLVVYYPHGSPLVQLTTQGATRLSIEAGLMLADLNVSELQAVVDYHDVATSAGTKAGLIRAIERELEVDP